MFLSASGQKHRFFPSYHRRVKLATKSRQLVAGGWIIHRNIHQRRPVSVLTHKTAAHQ
jgi:hypothetical protein